MNFTSDASDVRDDATLAAWLRRGGLPRAWVTGHDRQARAAVEAALAGLDRPTEGTVDLAVLTPETVEEATYFALKIAPRLASGGVLVVVWTDRGRGLAEGGVEESVLLAALGGHGFDPVAAFQVEGLRAARFRVLSESVRVD